MSLVVCYKCKKFVDIKKTALCSVCNNRFEPDCDGYPEHTYRLMNKESKNKWRCKACIRKKNVNSTESSNITLRKKPMYPTSTGRTRMQNPTNTKQSSPDQDSHILTDCDTSCEIDTTPNIHSRGADGTTYMSSISDMQDTIAQLTMKLECSENELENTLLENNDLKKQVAKLSQEINVLKSLCHSSTSKVSSPISIDEKKRQSRLSLSASYTSSSPRIATNAECNNNVIYLHLQQNIAALQKELHNAENEIKTLNTQIQTLKQSLMNIPKPRSIDTGLQKELDNAQQQIITFKKQIDALKLNKSSHHQQTLGKTARVSGVANKHFPGASSPPLRKNRLAIISSNCTRGSLPIIEEVFSKYFEYCNFIIPNVTSTSFLKSIKYKLKDFTMNDYCLIFVGESDLQGKDYSTHILHNLKCSLQNVTHTNIVICTPVYKKGALIYNYKVEQFNNLLLADIRNNEYAYFFDSNDTLSHDMFSYNTGRINKHGWKNIYGQIMSRIMFNYDLYGCQEINTNTEIEADAEISSISNTETKAQQDKQFFL